MRSGPILHFLKSDKTKMVMESKNRVIRRKKGSRPVTAYKYRQDSRYFAQIAEGIKHAGAQELSELGAKDIADKACFKVPCAFKIICLPRYRCVVQEC